eukprot:1268353-Lingulodinium_polyedra.AAC.1
MSVFKFRKFTGSRWCRVGDSYRSLVVALVLGLEEALVGQVRSSPTTSDYYIRGSSQRTPA